MMFNVTLKTVLLFACTKCYTFFMSSMRLSSAKLRGILAMLTVIVLRQDGHLKNSNDTTFATKNNIEDLNIAQAKSEVTW